MDWEIWRTEPDGQVSAEVLGLKLIVRQSDTYARYVILQRRSYSGAYADVILSSGSEATVSAAMVAAERAATRTALVLRSKHEWYKDGYGKEG